MNDNYTDADKLLKQVMNDLNEKDPRLYKVICDSINKSIEQMDQFNFYKVSELAKTDCKAAKEMIDEYEAWKKNKLEYFFGVENE